MAAKIRPPVITASMVGIGCCTSSGKFHRGKR